MFAPVDGDELPTEQTLISTLAVTCADNFDFGSALSAGVVGGVALLVVHPGRAMGMTRMDLLSGICAPVSRVAAIVPLSGGRQSHPSAVVAAVVTGVGPFRSRRGR